jgi:hypothetical protein
MKCSPHVSESIFAAYVIMISAALANPANIDYTKAYLMTQALNATTLMALAYCRQSANDVALAAGLTTFLAARASGAWNGGTRWDALVVTVGCVLVLHRVFYLMVPSSVPHRFLLYLGFTCMIMPIMAALPHLLSPKGVDDDTLRTALSISSDAYGIGWDTASTSEPKTSGPLGGPVWELHDKVRDTRAGVKIAGAQNDLYIYFAGTESLVNWKTDLNVLGDEVPTSWNCGLPTMRTHRGFQAAYNDISARLYVAIKAQLPAQGRIICTGHSLGGALATLAALHIACTHPELRHRLVVITFGGPPLGDSAFVKRFNALVPLCVRVVNPMDPVPRSLSAQLVNVKGYYPVGSFSLESLVNAHMPGPYTAALNLPPLMRMIAAFLPAILAALVVGGYVASRT